MTKLLIGLGLLTVVGALFGALLTLWTKLLPPGEGAGEENLERKEPERLRAVVHCTGGGAGFSKYNYQGIRDCLSASLVPGGGPLGCGYGCLGMGTCVKVCPQGAIQIREGAAWVDGERCTACGRCVEACPRHIIALEPVSPKRHVSVPCASLDREEAVSELCADGCIGCSLCVKACPKEAVSVEEGLARIDYAKCDNCGLCMEVCPRRLIRAEAVSEPPKPEPPKPPKEPKKPKRIKEGKSFKRLLPKKPAKEEKPEEEAVPPEELISAEIDIPLDDPASGEGEPTAVPVPQEEPVAAEPPAPEESAPEAPAAGEPVPQPPAPEEPPKPEPEAPATAEKPAEGAARTSAEAFKAFEQAVAAVDEALGEKKTPDSDGEAEPAGTKTE